MKILTAVAMTIASITAAHAGSFTCEGAVKVGGEWTTVIGDTGNYAPGGCRFQTASRLGRRILAACPNGSKCEIELGIRPAPTPNTSPLPIIKAIEWAQRTGGAAPVSDSVYCDEQPTKKQRDYCWAHGGDPKPGGLVDQCIKALAPGKSMDLCTEQR